MGNYKFKFSDMLPNAWFYKLNNISKINNQKPTRKKVQQKPKSPPSTTPAPPEPHHLCHQRKSYHFTRELTPNRANNLPTQITENPPRKSCKKRRSINNKSSRKSSNRASLDSSSSVSADCSCSVESVWTKPDSTPEEYPNSCSSDDSLFPEIVPEIEEKISSKSSHNRVKSETFLEIQSNPKFKNLTGFDSISHFDLPPIKTNNIDKKEATNTTIRSNSSKIKEKDSYIIKNSDKEQRNSVREQRNSVKKMAGNCGGVKLRTNSPRLVNKKIVHRKSVSSGGVRRSLSESLAIVKSSVDPHRDFKESMVEMIMENNIRTSKDLEDLLACYLSLNSDHYHDLIINVFKQIWVQITDIRFN